MRLFRHLSAVALTVFTLAACSSSSKVPEEVDANGKKIEYVYYTPLGSNIPVKIRKDLLETSDKESATDQQALRKLTQQSSRPNKMPGGN